jgi:predicted exporter
MFGNKSALSWFVMLILLCGLSSFQIKHHWRIQTDILALLPEDERDSVVQTLRRIVSGHLGRTSLFLVSHVQSHTARDATRQLGKLMESSEVFSVVQWDYSQQQQTFFELYFPLRYRIISPTLRRYLDQNDGYKRLIQRLKRELYHPTSSFITRFLEDDPLLFFPELMKHWGQNTTRLHVEDGLLGTRHDGQYHYLITAQLARSPFEESVQDALEENWHKWTVNLRRTFPGLELTYTSVARFAASTRSQMQKDILFISTGSIIGIAFLIITTFRSIKHLFIALIPLAVGLWSALGLSLLIFGELHAITLVFGASLIGICVDYSFHYFAHHRVSLEWESKAAMRHILPALSLGGLTTLLSYTGLGLTPLVGLRQIAVFASCGILVSFFTVVVGFPLLLKDPHPRAALAVSGIAVLSKPLVPF